MKKRFIRDWTVKKKIGLNDLENPTDEQIRDLADISMGSDTGDGVIESVIDNCSNISNVVSTLFSEYKELANKGMESNSESVRMFYQTCADTIKSFEDDIKWEDNPETRKDIREKIMEVLRMMRDANSENKGFIMDWLYSHRKTIYMLLEVLGAVGLGIFGFRLGRNAFQRRNAINIGNNFDDDDDDDDD